MEFINKFEEAAYIERVYFNNLRKIHNVFPSPRYTIDITPYTDYTRYDLMIYDTEKKIKFVTEIKVRYGFYNEGFVYERKKHNSLMRVKALDPENTHILYINSTPYGTYIWHIDRIISKYKAVRKQMNIATMASRDKKEFKWVYLLQTDDAVKKYPFKYDSSQLKRHLDEKYGPKKDSKKSTTQKTKTIYIPDTTIYKMEDDPAWKKLFGDNWNIECGED